MMEKILCIPDKSAMPAAESGRETPTEPDKDYQEGDNTWILIETIDNTLVIVEFQDTFRVRCSTTGEKSTSSTVK